MWHNHTFSQRKKATEEEMGWTKFENQAGRNQKILN